MNNAEHQSDCLVCGKELEYHPWAKPLTCHYCGKEFLADVQCQAGHYVCDTCHELPANDLIETYCLSTANPDPVDIATTLMHNPAIKMHGPEHHFLVPAVLLAACYNLRPVEPALRAAKLRTARKRAEEVRGGFCGSHGSCGAGVGTGIFISLLTNATPLSKVEWRLSNLMTSESLRSIAECGGPRCCKRDTYLALHAATDFLQSQLNIALPTTRAISCKFSALNRECLGKECQFFQTKA